MKSGIEIVESVIKIFIEAETIEEQHILNITRQRLNDDKDNHIIANWYYEDSFKYTKPTLIIMVLKT